MRPNKYINQNRHATQMCTHSLTQTHIWTHNYRYTGAATKASQQAHTRTNGGTQRYVFQGIYHQAYGEQNSCTHTKTDLETTQHWRMHSHTLRQTPEKQSQVTRSVTEASHQQTQRHTHGHGHTDSKHSGVGNQRQQEDLERPARALK